MTLRPLIGASLLVLAACASDGAPDRSASEPTGPGGSPVAERASAIHVNMTGYLPAGAKRATVVTDAATPLQWTLQDAAGAPVAQGQTVPFGADDASGQRVQILDFDTVDRTGEGFVLTAGGAHSEPFDIKPGLYGPLARDAMAFFYHQRASTPIQAAYVGSAWARPAAHAPDAATCYGPKDARGNDWGGCPYSLDVSKGWYDAGDHGKYVVNSGISTWTLLNYAERTGGGLPDGALRIPEAGNGMPDTLDEARWNLDFMLAMQVPDGTTLRLPRGNQYADQDSLDFDTVDASGMVHHKIGDEHWTGLPMPPHEDPETRYLSYPSTAATLDLAATAAQCARVFRGVDDAYADRCLSAARRAYAAAQRVPDVLAYDVTPGGSGPYGDADLTDEFTWAATELWLTTSEADYEEDMRASRTFLAVPGAAGPARDIGWGSVEGLASLSLLLGSDALPEADRDLLRQSVVSAGDALVAEAEREGYGVPFDRSYGWGSNGDMANRGIVLAYAYDLTGDERYRTAVLGIEDYLLGRNPLGFSYVAGYGENALRRPHHRFWMGATVEGLPLPPPGALAGGANKTSPADDVAREIADSCAPMTCYRDDERAYALNEVAINWNAPFAWITAFLAED